jgi:hypothetical protein
MGLVFLARSIALMHGVLECICNPTHIDHLSLVSIVNMVQSYTFTTNYIFFSRDTVHAVVVACARERSDRPHYTGSAASSAAAASWAGGQNITSTQDE